MNTTKITDQSAKAYETDLPLDANGVLTNEGIEAVISAFEAHIGAVGAQIEDAPVIDDYAIVRRLNRREIEKIADDVVSDNPQARVIDVLEALSRQCYVVDSEAMDEYFGTLAEACARIEELSAIE